MTDIEHFGINHSKAFRKKNFHNIIEMLQVDKNLLNRFDITTPLVSNVIGWARHPPITFFHYIFDGVSESLITFNGCLIFPLHFRVRWQWGPSLAAPGQKCDFWKVLGLARNPSKKMRLDESFRMVRVPCHLEVVVKSYGQITKITSRQISPPVLS